MLTLRDNLFATLREWEFGEPEIKDLTQSIASDIRDNLEQAWQAGTIAGVKVAVEQLQNDDPQIEVVVRDGQLSVELYLC